MDALGVDDWLLFLLVVDRIYGFFFFNTCLVLESWRVFIVNKKRDSRVMGSFNVVILTSCLIQKILVALSSFHSTVFECMQSQFFALQPPWKRLCQTLL
jgi:hypothetical protein